MNTADLITSFFNNELNPEQERQFLLTVAASDSMRLGLKSHVMLDRILADRAKEIHVPDSVRNVIFAEAGAMFAGTTSAPPPSESPIPQSGSGRFRWGLRGGPVRNIGTGLLAVTLALVGFGAGYVTHFELDSSRVPEPSAVLVPNAPQDQRSIVPAPQPASVAVNPTQSAVYDLNGAKSATAEQPVESSGSRVAQQSSQPSVAAVRTVHTTTLRDESIPKVDIPGLQMKSIDRLDPEERALLAKSIMMQASKVMSGSDSVAGEMHTESSAFTPSSVSATPTIRKSSDSDRAKEHDTGRP